MSRPVAAYQLAHSRREARHESKAGIELRAARNKARKRAHEAREVLCTAVAASGASPFVAAAILAAADSRAKAQVAAQGLAQAAEPNESEVDAPRSGDACALTSDQVSELHDLAFKHCPQVLLDVHSMNDADANGVLLWLRKQGCSADA